MFFSVTLSATGSAFGTAKAGVGMATGGLINPGPLTKLTLPVIMAGILSIYGLITMLVIATSSGAYSTGTPLYVGYAHFAAGLSTGIAALSAGLSIGISSKAACKCVA